MEQFTIVLVVLFCVFFLGCPVVGAITAKRRKQANAANPDPKDLYRARRKLSTVTTFSTANVGEDVTDGGFYRRPWWLLGFGSAAKSQRSQGLGLGLGQQTRKKGEDDMEANAVQLDLGECPICIGPLVPEPARLEDGLNAREILDQVTTVKSTPTAAAAVAADTTADAGPGDNLSALAARTRALQDRTSRPPHATTEQGSASPHEDNCIAPEDANDDKPGTGTSNSRWSRYRRQWTDRATARARAGEDDILSLNTCGHAFHAKCLASWFLIDRYDCPVCRTVYFAKRRPSLPMRALSAALPDTSVPSRNGVPVAGRISRI